jgi:hypothetical protein
MGENNIPVTLMTSFQQWRRKKYPKPELQPGMAAPAVMDYWIPTFESFDDFLAEWEEYEDATAARIPERPIAPSPHRRIPTMWVMMGGAAAVLFLLAFTRK